MRNLLTKNTIYGNKGANFKDLTGKKFGMLTVVNFHSTNKIGTKWVLLCECGNNVVRLASNFKKKQHKHSCGCISKNPGKKSAGSRRLFNDYKASAKNRGYSFRLSKKQFLSLVSANCSYCNANPSPRYEKQVAHKLLANGIDRIDNGKGYVLTNCVTCCFDCNRAKGNMSKKEFLDWIENVYYHNK